MRIPEELLKDLDGLLVTKPANVRYLSGFPHGEDAWLWIDEKGPLLLASPLYENDLKALGLPHNSAAPGTGPISSPSGPGGGWALSRSTSPMGTTKGFLRSSKAPSPCPPEAGWRR